MLPVALIFVAPKWFLTTGDIEPVLMLGPFLTSPLKVTTPIAASLVIKNSAPLLKVNTSPAETATGIGSTVILGASTLFSSVGTIP